MSCTALRSLIFFFFNDTATTEIYTLSLHDALPISVAAVAILRELGPVRTAILVGGKVASGITAELGSMKVTEQIDALRALGVNYLKKLVVPRLLAALLVFPLLVILTDGVGLLGGMVVMVFERNLDAFLYWNTIAYWVVIKDFLSGIFKGMVFGA